MDRNVCQYFRKGSTAVALLAEGVDRNYRVAGLCSQPFYVALLAEGVDRNLKVNDGWVKQFKVALLAEGVDRNNAGADKYNSVLGRPPRGGRG